MIGYGNSSTTIIINMIRYVHTAIQMELPILEKIEGIFVQPSSISRYPKNNIVYLSLSALGWRSYYIWFMEIYWIGG